MILSLSKKAAERTDHGQINRLTTVMRCAVDVVVDQLVAVQLVAVQLVVVFSSETADATARMAEELRVSAAAVSRWWWLSSLGYTVPSEISMR